MPVGISGSATAMPPPTPSGVSPGFVIQAILDTSDFEQRFDKYLDLMQKGIEAQEALADAAKNSSQDQEESSNKATSSIIRNLKSMRWQIVTFNFFLNKIGYAFRQMFKAVEEGTESLTARLGKEALLSFYKVDPSTAKDFTEISGYASDLKDSLDAIGRAALKDQGEFADSYTDLWRSAVAAAALEGTKASDITEAMAQSLHEGTGAAIDSASALFNVSYALQQYADSTGRFIEDIPLAERQQAILNRVLERGNELYEAGAGDAIQAAAALNELKDSWSKLTTIAKEGVASSTDFWNVLNFLVEGATDFATALSLVGAQVEGLERLHPVLLGLQGPVGDAYKTLFAYLSIIRGRGTEEYYDALNRIQGALGNVGAAAGAAAGQVERLDNVLSKASASSIVTQLLKYDDIIEEHNQRLIDIGTERAEALTDIDLKYNKKVQKIERDAARQREKLIAQEHRRELQSNDDFLKDLEDAERKYQLRVKQNREQFQLSEMHSEALYNYERQLLVARGDVLAIEDLDARYALEKKARQDNFDLGQRQMQEQFELQRDLMREAHQEQLDELRKNLQDQLDELNERRQEQLDDAADAYEEEIQAAKDHYDDLEKEEEKSLADMLKKWAQHWVDIADSTDLGTEEVANIIRDFLGPGSETEQIIDQFIARQTQVLQLMAQIRASVGGTGGGGLGGTSGQWVYPGIIGGRGYFVPKQYGGEEVYSRPTGLMVGEGYTPEVVSVSHMGTTNVALSWRGGPIPLQASGAQGLDLSGVGDAIAQGLMASLAATL